MILNPANTADLAQALQDASARRLKVERVDLGSLNRVLEHRPEDMTVTVQAGLTLAALQQSLARHNQWLPVDPPHAGRLSLREIIDRNPSGPRRFGLGTVRDYVIGIRVVLADGTVINSGGKVVKNVAGYDLAKLFIGGHGSLGVVVEVTFKLRPLPESERFVSARCETPGRAGEILETLAASELTPAVLDLHRLSAGEASFLVAGFAGSREEVEWQLARAAELGLRDPGSLDHETQFWNNPGEVQRRSVLPSKLPDAIRELNGGGFVARAGDGVVYHRGPAAPRQTPQPELTRRVKSAFDPHGILPDMG